MAERNRKGVTDTTSDAVGAGAGGLVGAASGAAIGTAIAGPIGTIIGGLAGAVGGWWGGRAISEAATTYTDDDDRYYQSHFQSTRGSTTSEGYESVRPAYQLGHLAGANPDYRDRDFSDVEPHLSSAYTSSGYNDWDNVRGYARDAYSRGRDVADQRMTLSEEQLTVGKREVQEGEVALRKSVETRHVSENVPLMHEEVTIERRPLDANASISGDVEITEDEIRIPLMGEEAVVEKRVVGKEEVTLHKHQVTENETVEADLRSERLDEDGLRTTGRTRTEANRFDADRTTDLREGGLADRAADTVDDLKDRVDGNPASRPGRDNTDRLGR